MRELSDQEMLCVAGGELTIEVGTDGVSVSGTTTDWVNAATASWNFAAKYMPFSLPFIVRHAL